MQPMSRHALALALVTTLAPVTAARQACPVVVDVNATPVGISSAAPLESQDLSVTPGGDLFFAATTPQTGIELWRSDGTAAGTVLVKDLHPGPGHSEPKDFFAANGLVYFNAKLPTIGFELWRSDGTAAGTFLLADIMPGATTSKVGEFIEYGGKVYFAANDGVHGSELWVTDGTVAGTQMLMDIWPGLPGGEPRQLTHLPDGSGFVFTARGDLTGDEPFVSDGTVAGTMMLKEIAPSFSSSIESAFVPIAGELYFWADDTVNVEALWRTDGTPAGTVQVALPPAGLTKTPGMHDYALLGGEVYFAGFMAGAGNGNEVWKTDGTMAGTVLVADVLASGPSYPEELTTFAGEVYFFADHAGEHTPALWATAGDAASTRLVKILPEITWHDEDPVELVEVGGRLMFRALDAGAGWQVWSSDGTTAGTMALGDLDASPLPDIEGALVADGAGGAFFAGRSGLTGLELHHTGGTPASTGIVLDISPAVGSASANATDLTTFGGNEGFLAADDGVHGLEPYRILADGTVIPLGDLVPGEGGSNPSDWTQTVIGGAVRTFFLADHPTMGREIFWTDGTPGSAVLAVDVTTTSFGTALRGMTGVEGGVVFQQTGAAFEGLYFTDGVGLQLLGVQALEPSSGADPVLVRLGAEVLFAGYKPGTGVGLWRTDGTLLGTQPVTLFETSGDGTPWGLVRVGGQVAFFAKQSGDSARGLYVSDGTAAGTQLVTDLGGAEVEEIGSVLATTGDAVWFVAETAGAGRELWRSDLTAAGTAMVADLAPGGASTEFDELVGADGRLYFEARVPGAGKGFELYTSDGTVAGTHLVANLWKNGENAAHLEELTPVGDRVFLSAFAGAGAGRDLYVSDGTTLTPVCDLSPSILNSSDPRDLAFAGGTLWFTAEGETLGREVHSVPDPGAHAVDLGLGRGDLVVDLGTPRIGANVAVRLAHGVPGQTHFAVYSLPVAQPLLGGSLSPGHAAWLNPQAFGILGSTTNTSQTLSVPIPANPGLVGARLNVQALSFDPGPPGEWRASNGAQAVVGP